MRGDTELPAVAGEGGKISVSQFPDLYDLVQPYVRLGSSVLSYLSIKASGSSLGCILSTCFLKLSNRGQILSCFLHPSDMHR